MEEEKGKRKKKKKRKGKWKIWIIYKEGFVKDVWKFYMGEKGKMGEEKVKNFENILGIWEMRFMIMKIIVKKIRDMKGIKIMRYRREIGMIELYYEMMNLKNYMVIDKGMKMYEIIKDIVRSKLIKIGMIRIEMIVKIEMK